MAASTVYLVGLKLEVHACRGAVMFEKQQRSAGLVLHLVRRRSLHRTRRK